MRVEVFPGRTFQAGAGAAEKKWSPDFLTFVPGDNWICAPLPSSEGCVGVLKR